MVADEVEFFKVRMEQECGGRFNNETLIKHEPLVYNRAWCAVQKKRRGKKRVGQYNSNNKLIH